MLKFPLEGVSSGDAAVCAGSQGSLHPLRTNMCVRGRRSNDRQSDKRQSVGTLRLFGQCFNVNCAVAAHRANHLVPYITNISTVGGLQQRRNKTNFIKKEDLSLI